MIVRIATEGQYWLDSKHLDHMNLIDNQLVEAVVGADENTFGRLFAQLLTFVRTNGEPVPEDELVESDVVLPPPDTTVAEARELFSGEGVLPG